MMATEVQGRMEGKKPSEQAKIGQDTSIWIYYMNVGRFIVSRFNT